VLEVAEGQEATAAALVAVAVVAAGTVATIAGGGGRGKELAVEMGGVRVAAVTEEVVDITRR
jgi:hypothetical protein